MASNQRYVRTLPGGVQVGYNTYGVQCVLSPHDSIRYEVLSDVHFDAMYCNRRFLRERLDWCAENNVYIIVLGDFFDVMCSRRDPRSGPDEIREEYWKGNYWDVVVEDAVKELYPYREWLLTYLLGNHETGAYKHAQTCVQTRLLQGLGFDDLTLPSVAMGYEGHLHTRLRMPYKQRLHAVHNTLLFHGAGGNAPQTGGRLKRNLKARFKQGYNLHLHGHKHVSDSDEESIEVIDNQGNLRYYVVEKYSVPSLKDERKKKVGWAVEKQLEGGPVGTVTVCLQGKVERIHRLRAVQPVVQQQVVKNWATHVAKPGDVAPKHKDKDFAFLKND